MAKEQKVQSVDRVFDILEVLASSKEGMTLTELSNKLTLSSSTTHRLLNVLMQRNYVTRLDNSKVYVVGLGFLSLISSRLSSLELKTEADPILQTLSHDLNQVVFLGVKDDYNVMYLDKKDSKTQQAYCGIGFKLPLHCTGLGKALLMQYTPNEIKKLYENVELLPLTPYSINSVDKLIAAVEENKARGYSIDDEENKENVVCVSAPIYDYRNKIIAAISTSWSKDRLNLMNINALAVTQAANKISKRMGYIGEH
ncbi:MAG: IclR family transcriptional regulator [Pleomorphochaeta sp.]